MDSSTHHAEAVVVTITGKDHPVRVRAIISTTALAAAGGLVAFASPASADLTTTCSGTASNTSVPGDLVVQANQSCTLDHVTVAGNVRVGAGSDLITTGGELQGTVTVGSNGYFEADATTVTGNVTLRGAFGAYSDGSTFGGSVNVRTVADTTVAGSVYFYNSSFTGNVDSRFGQAVVESSKVGGNLNGVGGDLLDSYDSTVAGRLTSTGNTEGSIVCASEVYGAASLSGNSDTVQLGNGAAAACDGSNFFGANVAVNTNTATVELNDNIIAGNLSGDGNDPAPTGAGNRVRGTSTGQFADLEPAAAAAAAKSAAPSRAAAVKSALTGRAHHAKTDAKAAGAAHL